jgi:hypothetical protein
MEFRLWWIMIQNDFGIVAMTIIKISILPKPIPMKHCHQNYYFQLCDVTKMAIIHKTIKIRD